MTDQQEPTPCTGIDVDGHSARIAQRDYVEEQHVGSQRVATQNVGT